MGFLQGLRITVLLTDLKSGTESAVKSSKGGGDGERVKLLFC